MSKNLVSNDVANGTHVLVIAPALGIGGAETHLIRYANGLQARGYRISLVIIGSEDGLTGKLSPSIECLLLRSRMRTPFLFWRLIRVIRQIAPDILVGWSVRSNFAALITSLFYRPRRLMLVELNYPPALRQTSGQAIYVFVRLFTRWLFPRADIVTANSDEALTVLRSWAPKVKAYRRILNPLSFTEIDKLCAEFSLSTDVACKAGEVLILAIGRILFVHKGFDGLVRACTYLTDIPNWKLLIIGSGPDESNLQALITSLGLSARVRWLSAVTNPFPFYAAADIVVLPSRFEGFPNVLFEALALGKATVSTDCHSGPREMTGGGRYGKLVDVDDDFAFARELRKLIVNSAERSSLGSAAKAYIRREYSEERVFDTLISCIEGRN